METKIITEFAQFKALETTTDEQLVHAVQKLNRFQKEYEGFLDAEISKGLNEDSWHIVFHYENLEWLQAIGSHLRTSKEFIDFTSLIVSESLNISFGQQLENWS